MKKMEKFQENCLILIFILHMCANFHHDRPINKDFFFGLVIWIPLKFEKLNFFLYEKIQMYYIIYSHFVALFAPEEAEKTFGS